MTVGDLETRASSAEVAEWHGYFQLVRDEGKERELRDAAALAARAGYDKIVGRRAGKRKR